ncbi:unnamed protein product, partial [Musa acuminata var. zebrina]
MAGNWGGVLFLEAAADAGAGLGGFGDTSGVEIDELGLVEGDLGVAGVMVDLHGLDVGGGDLAQGALELRVAALVLTRPIRLPRLAPAPVRRRRVDLPGDLFRRVLLRLRLPRHDGRSVSRRLAAPPSPCASYDRPKQQAPNPNPNPYLGRIMPPPSVSINL